MAKNEAGLGRTTAVSSDVLTKYRDRGIQGLHLRRKNAKSLDFIYDMQNDTKCRPGYGRLEAGMRLYVDSATKAD